MNEIDDIKKEVKKVSESLSHFMETGHLADNISHLTTCASILKILAQKLNEVRKNNSTPRMSYKVGDIVPYRNTRSNIKLAKITSLETVENGKIWFYGIDIVTGAKVWYPVHISERLELQIKEITE